MASKATITDDDVILEGPSGSNDNPTHILVVIDGLKDVSIEFLEWVLKNFTFRGNCTITLLSVMPWLNIPLSAKTWAGIWSMEHDIFDLCRKYGVGLEIKTETGHPLRLLVVEKISSLQPTLVVFDRHHNKKDIEYYTKKVLCNIVVVNDDGEIELINKRS